MAICEKCKNKYITRECPICFPTKQKYKADITYKKKFNKKRTYAEEKYKNSFFENINKEEIIIKLKKNYILLTIAIATSIIAIILIYKEYQEYEEKKAAVKLINTYIGTTAKSEKELLDNMNNMLQNIKK